MPRCPTCNNPVDMAKLQKEAVRESLNRLQGKRQTIPPALVLKGDNGFEYDMAHGSIVWLTVHNISLCVLQDEDCMVIEVYPVGAESMDPPYREMLVTYGDIAEAKRKSEEPDE